MPGVHDLFILLVAGFAVFITWKIRYSNMKGRQEPAIMAEYERAGIQVEANWLTGKRTVKGTLQSMPFEITFYRGGGGMPPNGTLVVQGADGPDFNLERKWDDMRSFLRLGSEHALQTGEDGMPGLDGVLPSSAERDAARALFHLGFEVVSRRGGSLSARKHYWPFLPELELLARALDLLEKLRGNRVRMPVTEEKR